MVHILSSLILYAILTVTDLLPLFRKKQWKFLWFSLTVFAITLTYHVLLGLNVTFPSVSQLMDFICPAF